MEDLKGKKKGIESPVSACGFKWIFKEQLPQMGEKKRRSQKENQGTNKEKINKSLFGECAVKLLLWGQVVTLLPAVRLWPFVKEGLSDVGLRRDSFIGIPLSGTPSFGRVCHSWIQVKINKMFLQSSKNLHWCSEKNKSKAGSKSCWIVPVTEVFFWSYSAFFFPSAFIYASSITSIVQSMDKVTFSWLDTDVHGDKFHQTVYQS